MNIAGGTNVSIMPRSRRAIQTHARVKVKDNMVKHDISEDSAKLKSCHLLYNQGHGGSFVVSMISLILTCREKRRLF